MKTETSTRLTLGGLCVLLLLAGFVAFKVSSLDQRITQAIERVHEMTIAEEVTNSDGTRTVTITTTMKDEEDVTAWLQRHKQAVDEFKAS